MGGDMDEVPCRYTTCIKTFENEEDMKQHMLTDSEHDFCTKCDVICSDWDDWLVHCVKSDKHNACPQCGKEFVAAASVALHLKRDHSAAQRLTCMGCSRVFRSAGDTIGHLEKGQCQNASRPQEAITKLEFQDHINHKTILETMLVNGVQSTAFQTPEMKAGPGSMGSMNSNSTTRGGVHINHIDSAADEGSNTTPSMQPSHQPPSQQQWPSLSGVPSNVDQITSSVSSMQLNGTQGSSSKSVSNGSTTSGSCSAVSPKAGQSGSAASAWSKGPSAAVMAGASGNNNAFAAALRDRDDEYAHQYSAASTNGASNAQSVVGSPAVSQNDWNTRFWNPNSNTWKVERFWNPLMQAYECPHNGCNLGETSAMAFRGHCMTVHTPEIYRCPKCLKEYKSLQAIMQHCESPSRKCNIRNTRDYPKFIAHITGGFVDASTRNERGEVIYQMTKPKEFVDTLEQPRSKPAGFW